MASVVFTGKEPVEFVGKNCRSDHFKVDGATHQGQKVSLDFWVMTTVKINQAWRVACAGRWKGYQEGFPSGKRRPQLP